MYLCTYIEREAHTPTLESWLSLSIKEFKISPGDSNVQPELRSTGLIGKPELLANLMYQWLKLETHQNYSPGELIRTQIAGSLPQSFWFSRSGGGRRLCIYKSSQWGLWCWLADHILKTPVLYFCLPGTLCLNPKLGYEPILCFHSTQDIPTLCFHHNTWHICFPN